MRLFRKPVVAVAGLAVILVGAAAIAGAAGGVNDVTDNFDDVLAAVHITGSTKVDVCHIPPDNPDNPHTISVGESALAEHLSHGDSEDACAESGFSAPTDGVGPSSKVNVCHLSPDSADNPHTISVGESALAEHLAHGDSEGACAESGFSAPTDGVGPSSKVDVCHLSPDNADNPHTISVGESALAEHLAHGDSEGACAEATSEG